jgi:hypothetical protein
MILIATVVVSLPLSSVLYLCDVFIIIKKTFPTNPSQRDF